MCSENAVTYRHMVLIQCVYVPVTMFSATTLVSGDAIALFSLSLQWQKLR